LSGGLNRPHVCLVGGVVPPPGPSRSAALSPGTHHWIVRVPPPPLRVSGPPWARRVGLVPANRVRSQARNLAGPHDLSAPGGRTPLSVFVWKRGSDDSVEPPLQPLNPTTRFAKPRTPGTQWSWAGPPLVNNRSRRRPSSNLEPAHEHPSSSVRGRSGVRTSVQREGEALSARRTSE